MRWNTKRQAAGDNNVNIQADGNINFGLGYGDVKEIAEHTAMEVFQRNFHELSQEAHAVAQDRASEFTRNFLESLQRRAPKAFGRLQDPGAQSAIYSAQSGYAKTGDADLGEVLIELLISRTSHDRRDTAQLAAGFALGVAENLSAPHFSLLTCTFTLKQLAYGDVKSIPQLATHIARTVQPFLGELTEADPVDMDYLTGLGCTIATAGSLSPGTYAGMNYPGLFTRGFSKEEFSNAERLIGTPLARPFGPDSNRYKINAITKQDLLTLIDSTHLHDIGELALSTLTNTVLQGHEIERMLAFHQSGLEAVFRRCAQLGMNGYINTAVGTAIAHANMRRVFPDFDLPFSSLVSSKSLF